MGELGTKLPSIRGVPGPRDCWEPPLPPPLFTARLQGTANRKTEFLFSRKVRRVSAPAWWFFSDEPRWDGGAIFHGFDEAQPSPPPSVSWACKSGLLGPPASPGEQRLGYHKRGAERGFADDGETSREEGATFARWYGWSEWVERTVSLTAAGQITCKGSPSAETESRREPCGARF